MIWKTSILLKALKYRKRRKYQNQGSNWMGAAEECAILKFGFLKNARL